VTPAIENWAYVYVIGSQSGPCKVGYSVDTERRLKDIQRPKTQRIQIFGKWPLGHATALAVERYAHWLLRDKQISGEWFDVTAEEAADAVSRAVREGVDPDYPLPRVDLIGRALGCGEHIATKFPQRTRERIRGVLAASEHQADLIREAVEAELKRREKPKP
jgi:hypothetical protein